MLLSDIRLDGGTQMRANIDAFVVDDYAKSMEAGDVFPAVVVFHDGAYCWLADGFHRVLAAKKLGRLEIDAAVEMGSLRDAVLRAAGGNDKHGLRRTNADKRQTALTLLKDDEWGSWSDSQIARQCNVTHPFVAKLRLTLVERSTRKYTSKTGKTQTMDVRWIGSRIDPEAREALRDSPVAESRLERKRLAELEPDEQRRVATLVVEGIAESVADARRQIEKEEMEQELEEYAYSDAPIDYSPLVSRHCRQVQTGEHKVMLTIDKLGFRRLLELLEMRGAAVNGDLHRVPGAAAADLFRQLLREGWERDVRVGIKDRTPQDVVAWKARKEDWTKEEFAARQIAKCLEELAELAECFVLPQRFRALMVDAGSEARKMFDQPELWKGAKLREDAVGELADVQVALFCCADGLKYDVVAEAIAKSQHDERRGVQ